MTNTLPNAADNSAPWLVLKELGNHLIDATDPDDADFIKECLATAQYGKRPGLLTAEQVKQLHELHGKYITGSIVNHRRK